MPQVEWKELSSIRHKISNQFSKLSKLELLVRDHLRTSNHEAIVLEELRRISDIISELKDATDMIDELTIKHDMEEV